MDVNHASRALAWFYLGGVEAMESTAKQPPMAAGAV